jgi:hypothetical protein
MTESSEESPAAGGNGGGDRRDLTVAVQTARRGFRRDVEVLVRLLDAGILLIPLAQSVPGASHGEELEVDEGFRLSPHMLVDDDGKLYCALFTHSDLLEPVVDALGWQTDEGALEYATVPASVALEMALAVIDEETVLGLVLNPLHDSELMLRKSELSSIVAGKAVPLVGYVNEIPEQDFEETLVAEPGDPPPPELVQALEACLAEIDGVQGYELSRTFNAERDVEPHPTLRVKIARQEDELSEVAEQIIEAVKDVLPPPGYIDVLFDRTDP